MRRANFKFALRDKKGAARLFPKRRRPTKAAGRGNVSSLAG
jgi:hypothetical protein